MTEDRRVNFLLDCALALNPPETHTKKLLKSYYITTSRKIDKKNIQQNYFKTSMCTYCSTFWSENKFKLKLLPRVATSPKARKLIKKLEDSKDVETKALLTKKQKKRAKWLQKRVVNSLEILCEFCQHKTLVKLQKPDKQKKEEVAEEEKDPVTLDKSSTKKKKNKKRDKTAGLKLEKIQEVKKTNAESFQKQNIAKPVPVTPQIIQKQIQSIKANSTSPLLTTQPKTPDKIIQNKLKSKKKKKTIANNVKPVAPIIKSKTQQENSLLKLAALLKTQTSKSTSDTTQKRLHAFLK